MVPMSRLSRRYKNTVRRRITELMSGTCLGCMLELTTEHSCSIGGRGEATLSIKCVRPRAMVIAGVNPPVIQLMR